MPNAKIDGKKPDSLPSEVKAKMAQGYPKRTAQAIALPSKPVSVKVR